MVAMKIHPVAELFPMLASDELSALADDIKQNGLQQPVVVQGDTLLDGRNRLIACELAGIKPAFREYEGSKPREFIVGANLRRRHLTRDQRDEVIRGLREQGMTLQKIAEAVGVGRGTVERATADIELSHLGKLEGADGKSRPAHYKPHVANNSGDNEWYTPKQYITAAREVMGGIDVDPASSEEANTVVKARTIYTAKDNGLKQKWAGKLWMNPPYASELVGQFVDKLAKSVEAGEVKEALVLVNNATETKWFARLAGVSAYLCFPAGRVKFWHPRKESTPLQGQCVAYIGKNRSRFCHEFSKFGFIAEIVK